VTRTAAALVQQQAATARISENLRHVETRMSSVHEGADAVTTAAGDTGTAAGQVLVAAESLTSISGTLRTSLDSFIATLRAA
jgi:methyl-accepting chemotaxis protein